jgi:hypothetical protein
MTVDKTINTDLIKQIMSELEENAKHLDENEAPEDYVNGYANCIYDFNKKLNEIITHYQIGETECNQ